ncbi:MAG: ribosome biogenesis GTP-binding protein YsxC [Candidatus Yonathbacteria bacterium CG_4_10_14_3_um_filter_47_65]|uniref:Probable GTP-binding protein EngB n=2 Tax=Parcubacteria group TaxID=1794811 RepID=A0A2M8D6K0_9BACT|nr:MAG: ribosome biogenesis GTP-binding protein YsxC [Candidatus Nomurabacteria bacterium CG1_02_47_685]PIP04040.1 MAG: ribosome biogenesis GTP-binding protein YsxC [Candidatus Yonathbacteria bacterium CG23_combo_of_CG06-09_8_20_14_all_46_18]PIQ32225.1 MAG: ribosome biogenesis GTP-binding protein YsxC [Candidatus Yonathbacteria bacterium CG17_big_fil_post_rev_8_21_14_2_50_46_19]PIX56688.1 MAG: ribosome biogenesis GTP-binding protein YsxC [Candidatus Yonathbacteria bacterium CG_4_10_14_3_um_filte
MNITTAEFVKGIIGTDPILEGRIPHVAFVGRSNAGKSSVINTLTGRKTLVKASTTPGKTQEINFFLVNGERYFVDLPGYGFAKIPEKKREKLRKMMIWYLVDAGVKPAAVALIVDANVGVTPLDRDMLDILRENHHRVILVANKIDKAKQSVRYRLKKELSITAGIPDYDIVPFSAKTGEGRDMLLRLILS